MLDQAGLFIIAYRGRRIAGAVGMARDPYVMKPFEFDADATLAAILRPGQHQMGSEPY